MKNEPVSIGRARVSDASALARLQSKVSLETYLPFIDRYHYSRFTEAYSDSKWMETKWQHRIARAQLTGATQQIIVARSEDTIIGMIAFLKSEIGVFVQSFYVDTGYRGAGVGTNLMEYVMSMGVDEITLEVVEKNVRAISFYQRRGFKIVDSLSNDFFGLRKLQMRRLTD